MQDETTTNARDASSTVHSDHALLLRRRVLSVEEYAAELRGPKLSHGERERRFGSSVVPVPVVLARGESEQQYEARFLSWLSERSVTLADLRHDVNRERSFRISFAERVAKQHQAAEPSPRTTTERPVTDYLTKRGTVNVHQLPRRLMLIHEYMDLKEYKRESNRGHFTRLSKLSYEEKNERFGSPYTPIYAPLAPGETPEMYEKRFLKWLQTKHNCTLRELEAHEFLLQERYVRMQFAALNAKGKEKFVPPSPRSQSSTQEPKREREACRREHREGVASPPTMKKAKTVDKQPSQQSLELCNRERREDVASSSPPATNEKDDKKTGQHPVESRGIDHREDVASSSPPAAKKKAEKDDKCSGQHSVEACRACGCRRCLLKAMRLLAAKILTVDGKAAAPKCSCGERAEPTESTDLPQGAVNVPAKNNPKREDLGQPTEVDDDEDVIEQRLLDEYETQNEMVVMNEAALEDSAAGLAELVTSDIAQAARQRDEDDEMRQLIDEEIEKRSALLGTLLVYMHRRDISALAKIVGAPQASNVTHVQRFGYRKCLQLAVEIAATRARIAEEDREACRVELETTLTRLMDQRRRELVTLVHFDDRVRQHIRGWLDRIQSHVGT